MHAVTQVHIGGITTVTYTEQASPTILYVLLPQQCLHTFTASCGFRNETSAGFSSIFGCDHQQGVGKESKHREKEEVDDPKVLSENHEGSHRVLENAMNGLVYLRDDNFHIVHQMLWRQGVPGWGWGLV